MLRAGPPLLLLVALAAGCPGAQIVRGYPPPEPSALLAHLSSLRQRATTLNAETKSDVRLGTERVNVTVMMLAAWGGKLRFQALDPNSAMAADLASDGQRYCFLDVHAGCSECGVASAETVARLVRIALEPDEVVAVLLGSAPVLDGDARLEWDAAAGHEILTITRGTDSERIVLDGKDKTWDVLEAEARAGGQTRWRIRHKDFHPVATAGGGSVRLPGASLFEQGGDTVRIAWRDQRVGAPIPDDKFRLTPPPGLPACAVRKQ